LHPDVLWVEREKKKNKKYIRIAQVTPRANDPDRPDHEPIVRWVGYKPYEGNRRVVVIDNAHEMNTEAQNAFLKTLEEPPPSSTLVLVTPAPGGLLPTIRSRCQSLRFRPLPLDLMREHLETAKGLAPDEARLRTSLAPGSLGRAIDLNLQEYAQRRDVAEAAVADAHQGGAALLASAETLLAAGGGERKIDQAVSAIGAVRDILRDLLVLAAGEDGDMVVNLDRADDWASWAADFEPDAIVAALNAVQRADDRLRGPLQPNARLTVEEALIGVGAALRGQAQRVVE
jgi:DNA polymerase-3 subunit delta'